MKNVKVVPRLVKNLFSMSTVMHNYWDLLTETRNYAKKFKSRKEILSMSSTKSIYKFKQRLFDGNAN